MTHPTPDQPSKPDSLTEEELQAAQMGDAGSQFDIKLSCSEEACIPETSEFEMVAPEEE